MDETKSRTVDHQSLHDDASMTHEGASSVVDQDFWPTVDLSALKTMPCETGQVVRPRGHADGFARQELEEVWEGLNQAAGLVQHNPALVSPVNEPVRVEVPIRSNNSPGESGEEFKKDPDAAVQNLNEILQVLPVPKSKKKTVSIASPDTYTMFHLPVAFYGDSEDDDEVFEPEVVDEVDQLREPVHTLMSLGTTPIEGDSPRDNAARNSFFPPRFHSESDESSYYDTVSSTSSTAALLRRAAADVSKGKKGEIVPPRTLPEAVAKPVASVDLNANPSGVSGLLDVIQTGSGRALLHKTLEQVKRSLEDLSPTIFPQAEGMPSPQDSANKLKSSYLKNLIVLSLGFMLTYTAFFAMRNLQSSIHHEGGLGLVSMACLYSSFVVGCFFATTIIHQIRPQRAIVLSTSANVVFILVNLHSTFYSMIPATLFLGFAMAVMWIAQGTYITSIGVSYAAISGQKPETILGLFNGFFLFLLQMAQILGNLISSAVLNIELEYSGKVTEALLANLSYSDNVTFGPDRYLANITEQEFGLLYREMNTSVCGSAYCHSYKIDHGSFNLQNYMVHTLVGIYAALAVLATVFMAAFLDKLDVIFHKTKHGVRKQLLAVWSVHKETNLLLMIALMVYIGMHEAFIYGEVTKAFITCPLGIHMIGYAMMCFGACDSVAAFVCGQLHRYIGRTVFVTFGAILDMSLLTGLYLWHPSADQSVIIFVAVGGLGVCDAIWQTQSCNLCGLLFPSKHREAAFASLRMYESVGFTIAFSTSQFLCMDLKILIIATLLMLALLNYYVLEVVNKKAETKQPSPLFV